MIYNNQYHSFERPILNILSVYVGAGSYTEWGCRIIAGQLARTLQEELDQNCGEDYGISS